MRLADGLRVPDMAAERTWARSTGRTVLFTVCVICERVSMSFGFLHGLQLSFSSPGDCHRRRRATSPCARRLLASVPRQKKETKRISYVHTISRS